MATDWHRLFGLLLTDFFAGSPFTVELEKDLSLHQQRLDVVVLRKRRGTLRLRLPDGLDDLVWYNLITFKSYQEVLDDWALKELTGHYVNLRKQLSLDDQPLLPEADFHLYAVCCRFPHNLAQEVALEVAQPGVYHCRRGTDVIRIVVVHQLPRDEHNAMLHLFSAQTEQVAYGAEHYRQRSADTSTLLQQLFTRYQQEGIVMSYTMEDFRKDFVLEHFQDLSPEEQQQALQKLSPEQRLAGLPPEQRLAGLPPEQRLAGLSVEEIECYLAKLKAEQASQPRKPRRKR